MHASREPAPRRGWVGRVVDSSYVVLLAGLLAVVDYRLHANPWTAAAIVATALAGVVAAPLLGRLGARLGLTRRPVLRLVLLAVPMVTLVVVRWRGAASPAAAVVAAVVPAALAVALAALGPRLDRALAPFARRRDRSAPRWLRSLLAGLLPVVITFWFVHGSLRDVGALVGLAPSRATPVGGATWRVVVGSAVAVVVAFLLLRGSVQQGRPGPRRRPAGAPARALPAAAAGFLLLGVLGLAALGWGALGTSSAAASAPAPAEEYGDWVCPEGFHWERMSANGCVQNGDTIPEHGGGLSYTQEPICRDPAYPHMITEWRETPTGEPIPGSGGKTALAFLVDCLNEEEYAAYLAQGGTTGQTPSTAANTAWVVGGGAVAAASLLAAAAAAGWTETSEPGSFATDRCRGLTARRNALVGRYRDLAALAGQRQGTIALLAQARAQQAVAAASQPDGTDWVAAGATAGNYGATITGGVGAGYTGAVRSELMVGTQSRYAAAQVASGTAVGVAGVVASTVSTVKTVNQAYATEAEARRVESERLARLTAQRWAGTVDRLERYQAWLEKRLEPKVTQLRADVDAFNRDMGAMDLVEGWWCPASALASGSLDDLLADTPPEGYQGATSPWEDTVAPSGLGHDRPRYRQAQRGSCATYAADLARLRAQEKTVRAMVERLDDEARVWGQRVADAHASARPLYGDLARLAARYELDINLVAGAGGVSASAGLAPLVVPSLVTGQPWAGLLLAGVSLVASLAGDLAFAPSADDAARIGFLTAQARFYDARARFCQAEYEQRAADRRTAWQQLLPLEDELRQRYEDCGRIWEDSSQGQGPPPPRLEPGHAPCRFVPTARSMEELASW